MSNKPESNEDCVHNQQPNQNDSKMESTPIYDDKDKPDLSVLKRSGKINCLTHFVAPWSRFGEPLVHEFPSSET